MSDVVPCGTGAVHETDATMTSWRSDLTTRSADGSRPVTNRMTGLPWDASYHDGPAPWDIGEPQPAIVRVAAEGGFTGAVLDAGCGTGDNTLHVASLGLSVVGG